MKKVLQAIVFFILLLPCGLPVLGQESLNEQLLSAAMEGRAEAIEPLLSAGANIETFISSDTDKITPHYRDMTPLMVAAEYGKLEVVTVLLKNHARIDAVNKWGDTALSRAAFGDNTEVVRLLLLKGAKINNGDGSSLLRAAFVGNTEIVQLLLERGADIEGGSASGDETPLTKAALWGRADVVRVLLEKGANIEAKDTGDDTPLIHAAYKGHADVVRMLLEKGANVNARSRNDTTPLLAAAISGNADIVKMLLMKGANVHARSKDGSTPLLVAAFSRSTEVVRLLLDNGADIEEKGDDGVTALIAAVCFDSDEDPEGAAKPGPVKLLLERGANFEAKYKNGLTPLTCRYRTHPAAVGTLLDEAVKQRQQFDEAQSKDPSAAIATYMSVFKQHPQDDSLRERILQIEPTLAEPSAIPEAARQLFTLATDQIKQAGTPAALDQPIALLRKALEIAPWWGNAYYNLSRVLEMRGQYDDAARQLNYYLELKPAEADAQQARAHLVVIQAEKDAAGQAQARQNAENEMLIKATAEQPLQAPVDNGQLKNQQSAATNPSTRSRAGNPLPDPKLVWTDPATGLEWTKRDNAIEVNWEQAKAYCANLRLGGAGWRLPTFSELQGIYDPSVDVPGYMGYPKLGYDVVWHVKGNLKLSGLPWSSSVEDESKGAWTIYYVYGTTSPTKVDSSQGMRVLCVRSSGE